MEHLSVLQFETALATLVTTWFPLIYLYLKLLLISISVKKKRYTHALSILYKLLTQSCMTLFTSNYYKLGLAVHFMKFLKNMYSKSKLHVKIGNILTDNITSKIGVRQVDILIPNLFKNFKNDLPNYFEKTPDPAIINSR